MFNDFAERYNRNHDSITVEEQVLLETKKVCVVGCGGLGGYIIEMLGRLGVGNITAIDGDCFDETNLNRQLLSKETLIGIPKAKTAKRRMAEVNSSVEVNAVCMFLDESNSDSMINDFDLVIDALDSIPTRLLLEDICEQKQIPLVHGAIAGWCGQVCTIMPGDRLLHMLYGEIEDVKGEEVIMGNPAFTPAFVASIEVAEAIKVLLCRDEILRNKVLTTDMLNYSFDIIEM